MFESDRKIALFVGVALCACANIGLASFPAGLSAEVQWRPPVDPTPVYSSIKWTPLVTSGRDGPVSIEGREYTLLEVYLTNHRDRSAE